MAVKGNAVPDILVVEDDDDIREILVFNLKKAEMEARGVNNGAAGLAAALQQRPDLIIMDLMMPIMGGKELCQRLKADARLRDIPVIMLTAKAEEADKVIGFELGADDYVTKPFSMREFLLRVQALLRRAKSPGIPAAKPAEPLLAFGDLTINPFTREASIGGEPLSLTATEFKLLYFLAKNANRVMNREFLLNEVWGHDEAYDRTVDTHIRRLRVKLKNFENHLETVRGAGYLFRR